MKEQIISNSSYFPENSTDLLLSLTENAKCEFLVKKSRMSKLGDFKYPINGNTPIITVNQDLNRFHFLITFLHELAHYIVWNKHARKAKAHGHEWKSEFSDLVKKFHGINVFPEDLRPHINRLILKPKASSFADMELLMAFRKHDAHKDVMYVLDELEEDHLFKLANGRIFRKMQKRRSRILCLEISSRKKYLIHQLAEVIPLESAHK